MEIKLFISGEEKTFEVPIAPMAAKRKYMELESNPDFDINNLTLKQSDELFSILTDIVFRKQFTLDDLYDGASYEYVMDKMVEAIYGQIPVKQKEQNENNNQVDSRSEG